MTTRAVKRLHPGDQVFWTDPDQGLTSRFMLIREIRVIGEVVSIVWDFPDGRPGGNLECFASELS